LVRELARRINVKIAKLPGVIRMPSDKLMQAHDGQLSCQKNFVLPAGISPDDVDFLNRS